MKGEEQATIDTPPNHRLFDPENAKLNPVLRKRAELAKQQGLQQAGTAPIINFSFGREFADLLRGPLSTTAANTDPPIYMHPAPAQNASAPPPIYTAPPAPAQHDYDLTCLTLLQVNRKAGVDMPLDAFCELYELDDGIRNRFREHRYKHARMFRFLTVKDLEAMEFMAGEVAEVRDAIDRWSAVV
jgi:hypothetical protein